MRPIAYSRWRLCNSRVCYSATCYAATHVSGLNWNLTYGKELYYNTRNTCTIYEYWNNLIYGDI